LSISIDIGAVLSWNVFRSSKLQKKFLKPLFWCSRSLLSVQIESLCTTFYYWLIVT